MKRADMHDEPIPMKQQHKQAAWAVKESPEWMGAEGTVGAQAGRHLRRRGERGQSLAGLVIGLSFVGGLTLGGVLGCLWRQQANQK